MTAGPPEAARAEPGTTVTLVPRRDADQWFTTATVTDLARLFGSLLPVTVRVGDVVTTTGEPPWPTAPGAPTRPRGADPRTPGRRSASTRSTCCRWPCRRPG